MTPFERESERVNLIEGFRALRNSHPSIPLRIKTEDVITILNAKSGSMTITRLVQSGRLTRYGCNRECEYDFDEVLDIYTNPRRRVS